MPKGSILVVDDESEIREGLELLLTSEGYGVSSAGTAESGLAKLEERPYDLLLLDVSLPDRNGLDLLKEIHRRDPHLSVVLITAYGSIDMARAAFKSGAMDYITKPWSMTSFSRRSRKPWNLAACAKKTFSSSALSSSASVFPVSSAKAKRCSRSSTSLPRSRPPVPQF